MENKRTRGKGIVPLQDTVPQTIKSFFWNEKDPPNLMADYDAIGFDMENCFIKYHTYEMVRMLVKTMLQSLVEDFTGYPKDIIDFNFKKNLGVCINNGVWDIAHGTILKITEHRRITHGVSGFRNLTVG